MSGQSEVLKTMSSEKKSARRNDKAPNMAVQARSAARLAAVQALYQMDMGGTGLEATIREFNKFRIGKELEGDLLIRANRGLFESILRGVVDDQRELDPMIATHLAKNWKLSRIDSILRAILRAGVYELIHFRDTPARVIMSEYISLADAFFGPDEPAVVNGVLNNLARENRPEEFE